MTLLPLRDENLSDDAEAELASQVGERGDEFALKPLRVEEAGFRPVKRDTLYRTYFLN